MPKLKKVASRKQGAGTAAARWSRGKPARSSASARAAAKGTAARTPAAGGPRSKAVRMQDALVVRDPSHAEIAHHAYMRWLRHGGSEHDNWFAAERELRERRDTLRAKGATARKGSAR